jgi:hypothetical protein
MNLRHAAALAIVTWYLMLPRASLHAGKVLVYSNAPLRTWARIGKSFDSITECEKAREEAQRKAQNEKENALNGAAEMDANLDGRTTADFEAARLMKCVSKGDSRIKGFVIPPSPARYSFIPAN